MTFNQKLTPSIYSLLMGSGQRYCLSMLLCIAFCIVGCKPKQKPFGPGNWPPASWRPYSDESPFNTQIPSNASVHPDSDSIISHILRNGINPGNLIANMDGNSGEPTYYSQPNDPAYSLRRTMTIWDTLPFEGTKILVPLGARVEKDLAADSTNNEVLYLKQPDAHLTIVDMKTGWEYDLWQVHRGVDEDPVNAGIHPRSPADTILKFSYGGRIRIDGTGLSQEGKATAAAFGLLAGRIRAEEMIAGKINHALSIVVKCVGKYPVPPAGGNGDTCQVIERYTPQMGMHLQLNMSEEEINALGPTTG